MNPTDVLETNTFGKYYTLGAQVGYSTDAGSAYLNSRYGDYSGKLFQIDLTTGWSLSDAFYLGFNGTLLDDDGAGFMGAALYPQYTLSESFALGVRAEHFIVSGDYLPAGVVADANGDGSVTAVTLTGKYSVGDLTLIPEFRIDATSEDSYTDKDGGASKLLPSFLLAAVYAF
ncbi:MAG: outer membrane beta-barrel protein, partial [Cytophagales bacterium]|nr:outer membrane beta-barrel protein [Cytophagales bacterium]